MAQIAQQDHLIILAGTDTFPVSPSAELAAKLIECFKAGTILDVVLKAEDAKSGYLAFAKTLGASWNGLDEYAFFFYADGSILEYDVNV